MAAAPAPHERRYRAEYDEVNQYWIITDGQHEASAHFAVGQRDMADWYADWLTNYRPEDSPSPKKK